MDTTRFHSLVPREPIAQARVVVCGVGTIGSFTVDNMRRMGFKHITAVDFDTYDVENEATQAYRGITPGQGILKVDALQAMFECVTPVPHAINQGIAETHMRDADLIVASFDNMPARRQLWGYAVRLATHRRRANKPLLYVDPRMGAQAWEINAVVLSALAEDPAVLEYEARLMDNSQEYVDAPCGAETTPYTGSHIAAEIASVLRQHFAGEAFPKLIWGDLESHTTVSFWREKEKRS